MTKILLSFLILFLHAYSQTPKKHNTPMLWEITGYNLTTPSYLFGTFHTRDKDINRLPSVVYDSLHTSHRLYTEIPMSLKSEKTVVSFTKLQKPQVLEKRLHPKVLKYLRQYLKESPSQLNLSTFDPYKTWAIALMVANQEDESKNPNTPFMDEQIVAIAKKHHIKQMGLETPLEQLQYFDQLNHKEQELFLLDMLKQSEERSYKNALISWYKQGSSHGFSDLQKKFESTDIKQQKLDNKLLEGLLYERNIRFTRRIHILLQKKPNLSYFFAIGAGHLSDELGLIFRLNTLGYTLKKLN